MNTKLDPEEEEILRSFEAGEWPAAERRNEEIEKHRGYARATLRKDRRLNIRISGKDLEALQKRALQEGIPYQTFIASILHKFVAGRLQERKMG